MSLKFKVVKAGEINPDTTVIARADGDSMHGETYMVINADKPHAPEVYNILRRHEYYIHEFEQKYSEKIRNASIELEKKALTPINMATTATGASVKIMLSYNYCHFEVSKSIDDANVTDLQINELRKDVQRLADEAIRQYKIAKNVEDHNIGSEYNMKQFELDCERIEKKAEQDRTIKEIAMLKSLKDKTYRDEYYRHYDYEDDDETPDFQN